MQVFLPSDDGAAVQLMVTPHDDDGAIPPRLECGVPHDDVDELLQHVSGVGAPLHAGAIHGDALKCGDVALNVSASVHADA